MSFLSPRPDDLLRWRNLRRVLILAALIGLIPGFYAFEAVRGRRAWQAYEREAMQRGVKLKFSEFIPPAVPDAENFASVPIFEEAFRAAEANDNRPSPLSLSIGKAASANRPDFVSPLKLANVDLGAWREYLMKAGLVDVRTDNAAGDVLRGLNKLSGPLDQLREASHRPYCRFPVRWNKSVDARVSQAPIMQEAIRVLILRIAAELALGDSASAIADFEDGLRLISAIRDEPALISGLVRVSMMASLVDALWGGLEAGAWSEADLRRIDTDLAAFDWLRDYLLAMNSERASGNDTLDQMVGDARFKARLFSQSGLTPVSFGDWKFRLYPNGWLDQSKVRINRYVDDLTARVDLSQKRFAVSQAITSSPTFKGEFERFSVLYFAIAARFYGSIEKKYVQIATTSDLARVACALERYRLKHGRHPAQLADLTPEFMAAVPVEIVNGDVYRYRLEKDGRFVLYSVGLDLNDDGGELSNKVPVSQQRDWVWRYPAR